MSSFVFVSGVPICQNLLFKNNLFSLNVDTDNELVNGPVNLTENQFMIYVNLLILRR